jgi:hypothetical protein
MSDKPLFYPGTNIRPDIGDVVKYAGADDETTVEDVIETEEDKKRHGVEKQGISLRAPEQSISVPASLCFNERGALCIKNPGLIFAPLSSDIHNIVFICRDWQRPLFYPSTDITPQIGDVVKYIDEPNEMTVTEIIDSKGKKLSCGIEKCGVLIESREYGLVFEPFDDKYSEVVFLRRGGQ